MRRYEIERFLHNAKCMKKVSSNSRLVVYKVANIGCVRYNPIKLFVCDTVDEIEFWLTSHPSFSKLLSGEYVNTIIVCTE